MSDSLISGLLAGRFIPRSLLGRGGMGEVWLARDQFSGAEVALKRVSPDESEGPVGFRHRTEFLNLSRLRHPSILSVHDYGIDPSDGARWFSSEVLRGPVSTDFCHQISMQHWFELCNGLLGALAFMHRNGWVHGDIKSDNVRLRTEPVEGKPIDAVLLDFGLTQREGQPVEEKILGTPHSMPPEQWLGERPDFRGDVYSAGILFHQWWCGALPFGDKNRARLGRAHLQEEPPELDRIRSGLPDLIRNCLSKMLAKRPDDRPRDAGEVWHLFQDLTPQNMKQSDDSLRRSLAAQIRYAGPSNEQALPLLETLKSSASRSGDAGIVLHLNLRGGDRRGIAGSVRTHLLADGIQVLTVNQGSNDVLGDLSSSIPHGTELVIAHIEEPGVGTPELRDAMEIRHLEGCRVLWWIDSDRYPTGYLGSVLATRQTDIVKSDQCDGLILSDWMDRAVPGAVVPAKLYQRLERWGQGSPAIWERILLGRVKVGQLSHDGLRWCWKELATHPEDRWRDRVREESSKLAEDELRILQALAILRSPATPSDVAKVAGIGFGQFPALVSRLVQGNWVRILEELQWCEPFQADGILSATPVVVRKRLHQAASQLPSLDDMERARHQLNGGNAQAAAVSLGPWLEDRNLSSKEASDLVELLTPLVDLLPSAHKSPWAELLGRVEDRLHQPARRDRAWRICESNLEEKGTALLRLARIRAHAARRDGDPAEALKILALANVSDPEKASSEEEQIRCSIEYSRIHRMLARRGIAEVPNFEESADSFELDMETQLESCRCALAAGARLKALDIANSVIEKSDAAGNPRYLAEAQCLRARSRGDIRSLRIWSCLHQFLCRKESLGEPAVVAAIESAESAWRLGLEKIARVEIRSVIDEIRRSYRGQLPRALLLLARCEAGSGWTRGAAFHLEEALTCDGPAGIVAWEGNLLVAASEWAAGRSQVALEILNSTKPHKAPHEQQCIDVHWRHAVLQSRCLYSAGQPRQALEIIDEVISRLRVRGTARDVVPVRRERAQLLDRLGHAALAQSEWRRIGVDPGMEPGTDPEPSALRRAREALGRRRILLADGGDRQQAERCLEVAALDVLRLRAQPLSTCLSLERSESLGPEEREQAACSAWKKVIRLESREGRAAVLFWWAKSRENSGDRESGIRLRKAAIREVDRWQANSPAGTRWKVLSELLGVPGLTSEALSGNGSCNASLA